MSLLPVSDIIVITMIDYIPYTVLYISVIIFITSNLYILNPSSFSPSSPTPFPSGHYQFVLCIYEFVLKIIMMINLRIGTNQSQLELINLLEKKDGHHFFKRQRRKNNYREPQVYATRVLSLACILFFQINHILFQK
uniref:Uncharacterized protein n=1 Tax=Rousettus aegyptiacus TaxID=9407 RepID=A0A7J8JHY4_ROUAE|nr:hypothetical protein HJG63_010239 [Rousettus aegyptiacus]